MNKKTLWTIVVMAFALNLGGILWIRSELLDSGTVGFSNEGAHGLRVKAFQPENEIAAEFHDAVLVVFNKDMASPHEVEKPLKARPVHHVMFITVDIACYNILYNFITFYIILYDFLYNFIRMLYDFIRNYTILYEMYTKFIRLYNI